MLGEKTFANVESLLIEIVKSLGVARHLFAISGDAIAAGEGGQLVGGAAEALDLMRKGRGILPKHGQAIAVRDHRMFAGKLNPQALSVAQRGASLLVLRGKRGDFRDWTAITQWADGIAADLAARPQG